MNNYFHNELYGKLTALNIKYFQYLFFDRSHLAPPQIFSTYPQEWLAIYQKQKLYYTDPIVNLARTTVKPFAWSLSMLYMEGQDHDFCKLAKQHGIEAGYTFSINDVLGNSAFLTLLCDGTSAIDMTFFDAKRAELQILLLELYDLYLREKKSLEYYRNKAYLMITEKERQLLTLGCSGLKYREIALKLGISERTVKYHMSNIVEKFNVETAKQAFLRAKELNVI
ncbi:LuxR family quorum-sensing system transcriptional regulator ExpR [Orbus hercynius]|uniref:LuxR family quorum-sensing system transcriptional regulator ExpR n=1 Tax=Orbus hercynius TaxID=593135 RepID=A0A495RFD2_9GAMM|nr:LuxR family transcriptional regulator [Orbus hercynius]RKS86091.1 LuxR family quorum-sensing system transcriptional regulator ExpR [Orbus hercynius]